MLDVSLKGKVLTGLSELEDHARDQGRGHFIFFPQWQIVPSY